MDDTKDHLESSVNSEPEVISLLLAQSGQTVSLHDGTTAFIHTVTDKGGNSSPNSKFIDGQTVQLEDGTTAFIQSTGKGLQAVQLEDGTTAYIHTSTEGLFDSDASTIGLEHFSVVPDADDHGSDKSELNRIQSIEIGSVSRISSAKALAMGDKAFRCSFEGCGRLYTTQHHLKVHERSHTGDRPFKCEVSHCNKAFATGYGLKSHTRVHTGEKPYKCPEDSCNKAFKTSGDLQKHVRTHTGERPFKCPYEGCDRSFTTSNIRKVHIRTHTGERPYICQEDGCGRAFASATNYKNHIRIHTGEKPYVCTIQGCGKRFTEYSSLYKHHVVHTHSKPYTCNLCGRNYRQTSTLAMHRRTSHGLLEQDDDPECILSEEDDDDCDVEPVKKGSRLHLTDATADTVANLVIQGSTGAPVMTTGEDIGTDEDTLSTLRLEHHKGHCSSRSYQAPQILVVTGTTPAQLLAVQSKTAAGFNSETTSLTAMVDGALITYSV